MCLLWRMLHLFQIFYLFQEWGASCPHTYLGGYRLEYDQSWTPLDDIERRSQEIAMIDKVLNAQQAITDAVIGNPMQNKKSEKLTEIH